MHVMLQQIPGKCLPFFPVTGEANFSMKSTSLTVGGFNQPSVARSLIELPGNAEKGLSQRFLWFFPKPVYGDFDSLEPIDSKFIDKIGMLMDNSDYNRNTVRVHAKSSCMGIH